MIGLLAGWLITRNPALTVAHARRLAKVATVAVIAVAAIVGWLVFDHFNDRAAVREHEAERVQAALEGERRASAADADRQAQIEAASRSTTERLEQIHEADPESATRPAGAGTRAAADRLRNR